MKPGRELDALVAEKVMGHRIQKSAFCNVTFDLSRLDGTQAVASYSTDISAAWEVVEKLRSEGFHFTLGARSDGKNACFFSKEDATREPRFWSKVDVKAGSRSAPYRDTTPHAICLAALKAKGLESYGP